MAKRNLNFLLQQIEVEGDEVRLDAHVANVLAINAQKRKDGTVNHEGQAVPSIVLNWLPVVCSLRNFLASDACRELAGAI